MADIKFEDLEPSVPDIFAGEVQETATERSDPNAPDREEKPSVIGDLAAAPFRGVEGIAQGVYGLADTLSFDLLPDYDERFLGKSKTTAGSVVEVASTFLIPFGAAVKGIGYAGKAARAGKLTSLGTKAEKALKAGSKTREIVKYSAAGALVDFSVFDGHEARLSNLVEQYPALANPITDFLAADPNDSEAEGRLKNAIEGLAIGGAIDIAVVPALRYLKKVRAERAAGKTPDQVAKATSKEAEAIDKAINEATEKGLIEKPAAELPKIDPVLSKEAGKVLRTAAKGKASGIKQMLDDLETMEPVEALQTLDKKYGKDGVLININAFTNGEQVAQEAVGLVNELYEGIRSIKSTFRLRPELRDAMIEETRKYGLDEAADVFQGVKDQYEYEAKLVAAHKVLRNVTSQFGDNLLEFKSLSSQLSKASSNEQARVLNNQLNVTRALFLQQKDQIKITAAALGEAASQTARQLRNFGLMQKADMKSAEIVDQLVATKLDLEELSKEELDVAIKKAAAVVEKHGAGGLAQLNTSKGFIDLHNELWINALLSGPKTFLVNVFGNALTSVYLPIERNIGARLMYASTKDPRYKTIRDETMKAGIYLSNLMDALELGMKAFDTEDSVIAPRAAVTSELRGPAITAENINAITGIGHYFGTGVDKAGRVLRIPTRALTGTDEFFKQMQFRPAAQTEAALKAHQDLIDEYGEELTSEIVERELPSRAAAIFEGVMREGGERYSSAAVRNDVYQDMIKTMVASGEEWDRITRQQFMQERYDELYDKTKGAISDKAFARAQEATFTTPQTGAIGQGIQNLVVKAPILRLVMPFVSTPLNIIKFAGQRTLPFDLPVLRSLHEKMADDLAGDPIARADLMGRQAVGTALWGGAAMAILGGKITGRGPSNNNERKILEQTGWRPYSIKWGDKYVSYQRLDPFATFLGFSADLVEYANEANRGNIDDPELDEMLQTAAGALLAGLTQNVVNKSYMTGLKQVMDAINDPNRFAPTFLRTRVASYVPSLVGQAVGTVDGDDAIREARTIMEAIQKRFPIAASDLDPRRNVLGEVVSPSNYRIPLLGAFVPDSVEDYVSPILVSSKKNDSVFQEMAKAAHAFQLPRRQKMGVDYTQFVNSKGQSAYDRWLEIQGTVKINRRTLRQELQRVISSKRFQQLSEEPLDDLGSPRAREITRVIRRYRAKAEKQMLGEFPNLSKKMSILQGIKFNQARGRDSSGLESELDILNQQLKGLR